MPAAPGTSASRTRSSSRCSPRGRWRFGLRRAATIAGLLLGLLAALVLSVALDTAIPALPFVAAGYLLPNADRLWALLAGRDGAIVNRSS